MKCKDCLSSKCKYAVEFGEGDCWYESNLPSDSWFFKQHKEKRNTDFDLQSFRAEAAKDILAGMMQHKVLSDSSTTLFISKEKVVSAAIGLADELIKQLKEKEEK